jgi:hypothetical protein
MSSEWKKQVDEELERLKQERSISTPLSNFDSIVNIRQLTATIKPIQSNIDTIQSKIDTIQSTLDQSNFYNGALIISTEFVTNLFLTPGSLWFQQRFIPIPSNIFSVWVMEDDYTLTSALDKRVVPTVVKVTSGNWGLFYKIIFGSVYALDNKILIMQPPKYKIANVLSGSFTIANQSAGWGGYRYSSTPQTEVTVSGLSLDTDVFNVYYDWGGVEFLHGGWAFYENASGSATAGIMYMINSGTNPPKIRIVVKASAYYSPMGYWILRAVLPSPSINKTVPITYARNSTIFVTELGSTLPKYVDIMLGNSTQNLYAPETITAYNNISSISTAGIEPPDGWGFVWKKIIKYNTSTKKWEVWVYFGSNAETSRTLFSGAYPNVVKVRAWY